LSEIRFLPFDVPPIARRITEAQNADSGVDDAALEFCPRAFEFALKRTVDQSHRRADVGKDVLNADPQRLRNDERVSL